MSPGKTLFSPVCPALSQVASVRFLTFGVVIPNSVPPMSFLHRLLSLAGHSVACHFLAHMPPSQNGTVTSCGKSNISLRLTPKGYIQGSPPLDRISKARGSRQPARWVANRPLCEPRE